MHGGVLPEHAQYGLERINQETADWLLGKVQEMPDFLAGRRAVVWAREYSAGALSPQLLLAMHCGDQHEPHAASSPVTGGGMHSLAPSIRACCVPSYIPPLCMHCLCWQPGC